jgi:hypothetical protein
LATIVSAGLTAPLDGKKLASTAERFPTADVIVGVKMQRLALVGLLRVVFRLDVDRTRTPVVLFAAHVVPALEPQNRAPVDARRSASVPPPAPVATMIMS